MPSFWVRNRLISAFFLFVFSTSSVYGQTNPKPCNRDVFRNIKYEVQLDPNAKVTYAGISPAWLTLPLIPLIALFGIPEKAKKINSSDIAKKCVADLDQMQVWLENLTTLKLRTFRPKYEACLKAKDKNIEIFPDDPIYDVVAVRDPKTGKIIEVSELVNPQTCAGYIAEKQAFIRDIKLDMRGRIEQCLQNSDVKIYLTNPSSKGYDERFVIIPNYFE